LIYAYLEKGQFKQSFGKNVPYWHHKTLD